MIGTVTLHDDVIEDDLPIKFSSFQCNLLLDCYTHGTWRLKPSLTREIVTKRELLNKFLLENLEFPTVLHRTDNRCGYGFPLLPWSIPALCDGGSLTPCCNEATGVCGNSTEHCACPQCKDFSKYVDAGLAEWKSLHEECPVKNFSSQETCALLNAHVSNLVLIGDSYMRHFFNALALLITNDPTKGALKRTLSLDDQQHCQGEMQFIDRGKYSCHVKTIKDWEEFNHNQVCEGNAMFRSYFVEAYNLGQLPVVMKAVENLVGKRGAVVAVGVGVHFRHNHTQVIEQYLKPLLSIVKKGKSVWPMIIWINTHQVDNFLTSDCKRIYFPVENFNRKMSTFCRENNIPVFETSRVTRNIKSHDGRHFGLGGNLAKVQILLTYLKSRFELCENAGEK